MFHIYETAKISQSIFDLISNRVLKPMRHLIIAIIIFIPLTILLRWPTIPFWNTLPMEPNSPLHALAALGLKNGDLLSLSYLQWPEGATVRYIGWGPLGISALLNFFLNPIPAFNLGVTLWLIIQGVGSYWLGLRARWGVGGAIICGISSIASVTVVQAIGNGQFENISIFALLWLWLACKNKWNKEAAFALFLVLFSSPYQGVVGLCIIFIFMFEQRNIKPLMYTLPLLCCVFLYYNVLEAGAHASVTPAGGHHSASASLSGLILPTNLAESGGVPLSGPWMRIDRLGQPPEQLLYSHRWPWLMTTATSYLGISLLCMGLWGIYIKRYSNLIILFLSTTLLAMGTNTQIGDFNIPLPWALANWIPGVNSMQATLRFLSGPTLALTIAIASTCPKIKSALLLSLFFLLDSLLIAPHHWPVQSKEPTLSPILQQLPSTPIAFWPAAPVIASHKVTTLALILQKPLILYAETNITMPEADGTIKRTSPRVNQLGASPEEWLLNAKKETAVLLQFRDTVGAEAQPFFSSYETCDELFCYWSLERKSQ